MAIEARLYCLVAAMILLPAASTLGQTEAGAGGAAAVRIPAYTAYSEPDPAGFDVSPEQGITGWNDPKNQVVWYGTLSRGMLNASVQLKMDPGQSSAFRLSIGKQFHTSEAHVAAGGGLVNVDFGSFRIGRRGTCRIALQAVETGKPVNISVDSLLLSGPAAEEAHFSMAKTRGAPSVHLWYQVPKSPEISWFYNEVKVEKDPLWSYYMACGFSRGYFGIQVNSPTERRIIFSVWNAGNEPTDPNKVPAEDRVQLLAKGENVFAGAFGNEGTGGHSHLVYPWKTGHTYRFLVTAKPDGDHTTYSGYFYFPEKKAWGLIASFRAPKDGGYLRGLYSFDEDFNGANGQQQRKAEFGPQWIRTADGKWIELTTVHFTHTSDGAAERLDRGAAVSGHHFTLMTGGFEPQTIRYNATLTRPAAGRHPSDISLPPNP